MTKFLLIIVVLLLAVIVSAVQNNKSSKLLTILNDWLSAPEADQKLSTLSKDIHSLYVNTKAEAEMICRGLEYLKAQFSAKNYANLNDNLYTLALLFQRVKSKQAYRVLNERGIPLLVEIFNLYRNAAEEEIVRGSFREPDVFILKIFAQYNNPAGTKTLIEAIKSNYKPGDYRWHLIFDTVAENDRYNTIIGELGEFLPADFAGISYLDMCNRLAIEGKLSKHPFDNEPGYQFLRKLLQNQDPDEFTYTVSATAALPFINSRYQTELFKLASGHPDIDVRIETAWAGAKLGDEESLQQLVEFAKDYRYGKKPVRYLKELGKESLAPAETKDEDFQALVELCHWLSHPNEFGSYPDAARIVDKRELYWPSTEDRRTMYIIEYTYKNYNEDGSDKIGVGMVGSITFCLFRIEGLANYSPEEIYAIHCAWELDLEDYENPETGLEILRRYNNL